METAVGSEVEAALAQVAAALDVLTAVEVALAGPDEALAVIRAVEVAARRVRSVQVGLVTAVEAAGVHRRDGHASGRVMVGHGALLSVPEAKRRAKTARALADLPAVAAGLAEGAIGICHADRIARTHANPRVRDRFTAIDAQIAVAARRVPFRELDELLTSWERRADEDGTADHSARGHENRDARIVDDYDGGWRITGGCGSLDGAELHTILVAFTHAEFEADWAAARAIHGEATTLAHLPRTDNQRRFDALLKIFRLSADQRVAAGGSNIDTNIVIDHHTFERHLARLTGTTPTPHTPPLHTNDHNGDGDVVGYRCATTDGTPIDPTQATLHALLARVRRVVIGAEGVVIDLGRRSRTFTNAAHLAATITTTHCYWPGCHTPTSHTHTDHLTPWRTGGTTTPTNGAPLCPRHNRHKEHGYTVTRDHQGNLHILKPDGTPLE